MLERPRRNRATEAIRSMVRETRLDLSNLIYPLFVVDGSGKKEEIGSLPGIFRFSEDQVLKEVEQSMNLGLRSFVLFPGVEESLKDKTATYSYDEKNPRSKQFQEKVLRTTVEKGASIGAGAILIGPVRIGEYAMVGAGAVVTKDIPPYTVVVGNPAKTCGIVDKNGIIIQPNR